MLLTAAQLTTDKYVIEGVTARDSQEYVYRRSQVEKEFVRIESKLERREYQLDAAAMYCTRRNNLAALSQGLGKTLIATLLAKIIYDRTNRAGTIHICLPNATAIGRWLEDLQYCFETGDLSYVKGNLLAKEQTAKILIYTHDFGRYVNKCGRTNADLLIKHYRPSLLVIDEVHHLSDRKSLKYVALSKIARAAKRRLGLSGTLAEGSLIGLNNILELIYQRDWVYYRQPQALVKRLGVKQDLALDYQTGRPQQDKGRQMQTLDPGLLPNYSKLLGPYVHRISIDRPDIKAQIRLPKIIFESIEVSFSLEQAKAYQEIIDRHASALSLYKQGKLSGAQLAKAKVILNQLVKVCNVPASDLPTAKVSAALKAIDDSSKTVVFCQYVASASYLHSKLTNKYGADRVVRVWSKDEIVGSHQSLEQRWAAIAKFEADPNVKVGVFSLNLAAEALDLVAADRILVYCAPWSAVKFDQCLRRCVRPGNRHAAVKVTLIYHQAAIDRYQLQLIAAKQQANNLLLDYTTTKEGESLLDAALLNI